MPGMIPLKFTQQGPHIVARNEDGSIARKSNGEQVRAVCPPNTMNKETIRRAITRLTNGGEHLIVKMLNLSAGNVIPVRGLDGREHDPIIPTAEVQLAATKDLLDRAFGKAVAQTEVLKAEQEAEDMAQYAAMSDEQLREAAAPYLERVNREKGPRALTKPAVTVTVPGDENDPD